MSLSVYLRSGTASVFLWLVAMPALAQDSLLVQRDFIKQIHQIPMRDGKKLFTIVYVPKDSAGQHPIILRRTPYSIGPYHPDTSIQAGGALFEFMKTGYIVAFQDVRGQFMSEGEFMDVRPQLTGSARATDTDESTDAWDTIDWMVKNVRGNNGRVGMYGVSYPGFYSALGGVNAHPALKVTSPQAPVADWFIGDDFHHNGGLYLAHTFHFFSGFGKPRATPTTQGAPGINIGTPDGYRFFLKLGPLSNINKLWYKDSVKFWNEMVRHGTYDEYWKARNILPHLKKMPPAVMTVGGWFDAEDLWGPLKVYESVEQKNPGIDNVLVMGPWDHGGWSSGPGDFLGAVRFGSPPPGPFFRDSIFIPFFRHYLGGAPRPNLPEAFIFETGSNIWKRYDGWPPRNARPQSLYMGARESLSMTAPAAATTAYDEYVSDPAKPVPYINNIARGMTREHMLDDQRFAATRPDVLVYESDVLTHDMTVVGPITATLYVSTSGTDSDWVVKLIDVYPDTVSDPQPNPTGVRLGGYQQLVRGELFRGKFRNSFEKPVPFVPNRPTKVEYVLPDVSHTFLKGHRIMVQIQSSWFPLVDRNPQTFVDIYSAKESDFRKATQRVYRSARLPSHLSVGVIP